MLAETDKYLLGSIKKGDYRAYEVLFTCYYSDLCKYAFSFVNSSETAEDIVSEFFMKLWEQPGSIIITTTLKGYLFRSIHNSCLNYLTRSHRNFQELDHETIEKLNPMMPHITNDDQLGMILVAELEEKIDKAINLLPEECGRVFLMSRKEGFSHREIANKLKISENTVKVQIYRALSKIRGSLENYL
jgi:RNA polymerase sigma-70 factor (ECF subfamily)